MSNLYYSTKRDVDTTVMGLLRMNKMKWKTNFFETCRNNLTVIVFYLNGKVLPITDWFILFWEHKNFFYIWDFYSFGISLVYLGREHRFSSHGPT